MLFQLVPLRTFNRLNKVSQAQKLWKQKVFKIHKNQSHIMAKVGLKLNSNTKHENEKQEHRTCKIKVQK
jgi:hypothetical protein